MASSDERLSKRYDELIASGMTDEMINQDLSILETPTEAEQAAAARKPPANPAQATGQRSALRRFDDAVFKSTGLGAALEGINEKITWGVWPALQQAFGQDPDEMSKESPTGRFVGDMIGTGATLLPSAGTSAAPTLLNATQKAAAPAASQFARTLSKPAQMVEQQVAESIATRVPAQVMAQAGGNAQRAARMMPGMVSGAAQGMATDGPEGALGGAAGSALGNFVMAGPAGAVNRWVRNPRRMTGAYVNAMERGADDLAAVNADESIMYGGLGVRQVAGREGEKLGQVQASKLTNANKAIEQAEAAIPELNEMQRIPQVHRDLNATIERYSNTMPVDEKHAALIEKVKQHLSNVVKQRIEPVVQSDLQTNVRRTLSAPQGPTPPEGIRPRATGFEPDPARPGDELVGYSPGEKVTGAAATPMDILKQRRQLRKEADFGQAKTPENAAAREAYAALNKVLHNQKEPWAKALAEMDDAYRAEMEALEASNEFIYGKADARFPTETLAARKKAGAKLGQAMKDTQTGGDAMYELDELANLGPEYRRPAETVKAVAADRASRFGFNPAFVAHPGKWGSAGMIQNLDAGQVRLLEPMSRAAEYGGESLGRGLGLGLEPYEILRNPADGLVARRRRRQGGQ